MAKLVVIEGGQNKPPIESERDEALKRLALQIAVQLPSDNKEAYRVLEHLQSLLGTFLAISKPV